MAIGKYSDFKIYDDRVQAGYIETLAQMTDAFNTASRNTIRMVSNRIPGHFGYESFFQNVGSLVSRRDITSVAAATDLALTQEEHISVKLNRKIGPVAQTLDAFRKKGLAAGQGSLSFLIGTQVAKAVAVEQLNTAVSAGVTALLQNAAVLHDGTAGTLNTAALVSGLAKFGDSADRIVAWVMHSKNYYDLVQSQITANIDGVSNFVVANASPITLNRPVIVTDAPGLFNATPTPDNYYCLGLTADAIRVEDSEEELIMAEIVTGLENLVVRLQGEFAYNLAVKGYKFDVTNGGINPAGGAIATAANWDKVATSDKDVAGIIISSQ
jgi:hypothetical protein